MASSSEPRGGKDRPPDARPPKVKTTWEEQQVLAAKLREMGVTCRACLEGPWYHKPHAAVGEKCYKHMISTGTVSSPLSVAALRKRGDATPARTPDREDDEGGNNTIRAAPRSLSEQVRFETREGNVLLYDPSPLDRWIGTSCRWDTRRQLHVQTNTGEALSAEDSEDYQRYVQRHNQRRQTGNQADELIKLVAKHNPAVEAELRFYIAKFPGEVRRLLAEGKQVYKPLVDKRRHGGTPSAQTAEPRHQRGDDKKTKKENEKQKEKKGEKAKKHKKHEKDKKDKKHKKAKKSRQDTPSGGEATTEQQQQDDAAEEPPTQEEVDWGSEGDDTETQPAVKAKAVVGENGSGDSPPVMPLDAKWPWGEQGRPSDMASSSGGGSQRPRTPSRSPRRQGGRSSSGGGSQRPRTPSRSPRRQGRRHVELQPSPMWEAVQQVQLHMRKARTQ